MKKMAREKQSRVQKISAESTGTRRGIVVGTRRRKGIQWSSDGIRELRSELGLSQQVFARLIGFSLRTVAGWEGGKQISPSGMQRVRELGRLKRALSGVISEASVPVWFTTANPAFNGLSPVEVVERGESDRIWRMIFELESGMPG